MLDDDDLHRCADIDECNENDHMCDELCINTPGAFHCDCPEGKELYEITKCQCMSGYQPNANGQICLDINECDKNVCAGPNTACQNAPGSYSCTCVEGFASNVSIDGANCLAIPKPVSDKNAAVIAGTSVACILIIALVVATIIILLFR